MGDPGQDGMPGMDGFGGCAVYTIWGRTECPSNDGTQTLTQGLAASPRHSDEGGASNFMCLPNDPAFLGMTNGAINSEVVGVKYETANEPLANVDGQAVPCAVCSTTQSVQIMIPGRGLCPAEGPTSDRDWRMEYNGYLMSARDTDSNNLEKGAADSHFRTKYICVDAEAEGANAAATSEAAIYHVHVDCTTGASLECGNILSGLSGYDSEEQIPCVVCTLDPPPLPTPP